MSSILDMMEQAGIAPGADSVSTPGDQLPRLTMVAKRMLELENEIAQLEADVDERRGQLHELRTKTLPAMMTAAGSKGFKMLDGSVVEIRKEYLASIPSEDAIAKAKSDDEREALVERRKRAFAWLRENRHDDLIKNKIAADFGKGEDAKAAKLVDFLLGAGARFTQQESVHPATLKAFVREQIEKGREIDMAALGADVLDIAKITPAKKAKEKKSK